MNAAEKKEYDKEYYRTHKKEIDERQRKYNEDNKEEVKLREKAWREKNKEKIKEKKRLWYIDNKDVRKKYLEDNKENFKEVRSKYYKNAKYKKYGITEEQYSEMYDKQEGRCAICGISQDELSTPLHIDHDHKTEKTRKLLCMKCNRGLGFLNDDVELLLKAVEYLRQYL